MLHQIESAFVAWHVPDSNALETRFINDLLDLTRISQGKLELNHEAVDVHAVIEAAVEICQADFKVRDQKLTCALNARQTKLLGDFARLQQCFGTY